MKLYHIDVAARLSADNEEDAKERFGERPWEYITDIEVKLIDELQPVHDDLVATATPGGTDEPAPKRTRPVCAVHQQPMWRQKGKYGWFWSCHARNADGSYCRYRPAQAAA